MTEKPDEQLSGKVVCDDMSEPHEMGAGAGGKSCVNPRPAQQQAPDARATLREIFLEAGFLTNDPQASRRAIRELAEAALAASPSVTREQEVNAAWINGCLAGREEAALAADRLRHGNHWEISNSIRSLPAPTAPKEPL